MNKWMNVPSEPAMKVYWKQEDEATIIKRTVHYAEYVRTEKKSGRNVLCKVADDGTVEPWRKRDAFDYTDTSLQKARKNAGTSKQCACMVTYVDDCVMDGAKTLRSYCGR